MALGVPILKHFRVTLWEDKHKRQNYLQSVDADEELDPDSFDIA